ncbi:MAG: DUF3048 domain-containing protein [Mycobacteriales bacterium]
MAQPAPAPPKVVRHLAPPLRWPLTGQPRTGALLPALSVKIDNIDLARPQSGLNQADMVVECLVEGGLTRLLAVYDSQSSSVLGPIRSARPVDGALLRALHGGVFAYSGAAAGEIAPAKAYSTSVLISNDADPGPFRRTGRRPPENVYASTDSLRAAGARLSSAPGLPGPWFTFGPAPKGAASALGVQVGLSRVSAASWTWDGSRYVRAQDGTPDILADGSQVSAADVVVLRVTVGHSGIIDSAGNEDPFVHAFGSGSALVLRSGQVERGTWSRPSVDAPWTFRGPGASALTLAPGRVWVELVPTDGSVALR